MKDLIEGIVIKAQSGVYEVMCHKVAFSCSSRGKIKQEILKQYAKLKEKEKNLSLTSTFISVGDRVKISIVDEKTGVIEEILPRKNEYGRSRIGRERSEKLPQIIAVNLDQLMMIFAAKEPDLNLRMLDRFLVIAEAKALDAVICLNKIDLVDPNWARSEMKIYEDIGYNVIYTSALSGEGINELKATLEGKVSAICGPSGSGKSSLLNGVQPGLKLRTGKVSEKLGKGRHTTTEVELIPLEFGGFVADTPGLRSVGFFEIPEENLSLYFPEMRVEMVNCKFSSCSHVHEPACAVKGAVESGKISRQRYDSYLRLRGE